VLLLPSPLPVSAVSAATAVRVTAVRAIVARVAREETITAKEVTANADA